MTTGCNAFYSYFRRSCLCHSSKTHQTAGFWVQGSRSSQGQIPTQGRCDDGSQQGPHCSQTWARKQGPRCSQGWGRKHGPCRSQGQIPTQGRCKDGSQQGPHCSQTWGRKQGPCCSQGWGRKQGPNCSQGQDSALKIYDLHHVLFWHSSFCCAFVRYSIYFLCFDIGWVFMVWEK